MSVVTINWKFHEIWYWKCIKTYLHGTLHVCDNTRLSFTGIGFAPWSECIEKSWFSCRTGRVVDCTTTASSTFCAITSTVATTSGSWTCTRSLPTTLARAGRTGRRRFSMLLGKRSGFSWSWCASGCWFSNRSWMRTPGTYPQILLIGIWSISSERLQNVWKTVKISLEFSL